MTHIALQINIMGIMDYSLMIDVDEVYTMVERFIKRLQYLYLQLTLKMKYKGGCSIKNLAGV